MRSRESGRHNVGCILALAMLGGVIAAITAHRPSLGAWQTVLIGVLGGVLGVVAIVAFVLVICAIDWLIRWPSRRRGASGRASPPLTAAPTVEPPAPPRREEP